MSAACDPKVTSTRSSGPTVADPTTYADAIAILARHGVTAPPAVEAHLRRGAAGSIPETPKPGSAVFARARTCLVGRNGDAVGAAAATARARGYAVTVVAEPLDGDAADAGARLARTLRDLPGTGPVGLVAGGETTVRARPGGVEAAVSTRRRVGARARQRHAGRLLAAEHRRDRRPDRGGRMRRGRRFAARRRRNRAQRALATTDSHRCSRTGDLVVTGPIAQTSRRRGGLRAPA
jgi:glycerate-2-kinase